MRVVSDNSKHKGWRCENPGYPGRYAASPKLAPTVQPFPHERQAAVRAPLRLANACVAVAVSARVLGIHAHVHGVVDDTDGSLHVRLKRRGLRMRHAQTSSTAHLTASGQR